MGNAVYAAPAGARAVALETQIKRFERAYRRRLRKFTRTSSRHGDLLFTFPAAAFALVSGRGTVADRGVASGLVRDGAALAEIGRALGLPMWLRRLPPEAFVHPIGRVATGEAFGRKIIGRLPGEAAHAASWLQAHEIAVAAADEDFAYWLAGLAIYGAAVHGEVPIRPLAIFAWYSRQKEVRARTMMQRAWTKQMHFQAAVGAMCEWYERVIRDLTRADAKRGPGRYSRRRGGVGYTFVPLRSAVDLRQEGDVMRNCVGSYAGMVAARECLIYSVRRGGLRVATLEVRWRGGKPTVWQLEAPGNTSAGPVIWEAVNAWVAEQDDLLQATPAAVAGLAIDATRWKALWAPYVAAKGGKAGLLERPDNRALATLVRDIDQLVQIGRG